MLFAGKKKRINKCRLKKTGAAANIYKISTIFVYVHNKNVKKT